MPRKDKKFNFIYKTTNLINEKYYIGMHSTDNLNDGYVGSGKRLWYSINKYGKENFKIEHLKFFETRKELVEGEKEIVNSNLLKDIKCINLKIGGTGGFPILNKEQYQNGGRNSMKILWNRSEFRDKVSKRTSEQNKKLWKDGILRYKDNWTGRKHTEETKNKISVTKSKLKGDKTSQFGTCWITNDIENKKIKKTDIIPDGWKLGRINGNKKNH